MTFPEGSSAECTVCMPMIGPNDAEGGTLGITSSVVFHSESPIGMKDEELEDVDLWLLPHKIPNAIA